LLVVFGENDYIIPPEPSVEHIKENAKKSPLIKVVLIKKAEHSPGVENEKETLKEITSFLLNI
jgi:pimeloyl-ACP methyl ester carboxylesterase